MQFTRELMKIDDVRSLVLWVDGNENDNKDDRNKYVICSYYEPTLPFGQQWCWGHYFDDLASAYEYAKETKHYGRPNEHRIREIAETAISWMHDNDCLDMYLEDRDIDLTQDEREYFVIDEDDEEEDE